MEKQKTTPLQTIREAFAQAVKVDTITVDCTWGSDEESVIKRVHCAVKRFPTSMSGLAGALITVNYLLNTERIGDSPNQRPEQLRFLTAEITGTPEFCLLQIETALSQIENGK